MVTLRGQKIFFSKTDNFPQFRRPKYTNIETQIIFSKNFRIWKKRSIWQLRKNMYSHSVSGGSFFTLLSSIYTFNGISISFIIFRSRFKFILTPLIELINHLITSKCFWLFLIIILLFYEYRLKITITLQFLFMNLLDKNCFINVCNIW